MQMLLHSVTSGENTFCKVRLCVMEKGLEVRENFIFPQLYQAF